jgi:GMP synthase-like glutamine amidotransferase
VVRVLVVQNDPVETMGIYPGILRGLGADVTVFHAYRMAPPDEFPAAEGFDAFMFSAMVPDVHEVPGLYFLQREWEFIERVRLSGKPALGICGGAQFLAYRLGARVAPCPREIGCYRIRLTDEGASDPLFEGLPRELAAFLWHGNGFEVPAGGQLTATGDPCSVQGFRLGGIRGTLFRFELNSGELEGWLRAWGGGVAAVGKTPGQVLEECRANDAAMRGYAETVARNLVRLAKPG